jgi:hypothetical protein
MPQQKQYEVWDIALSPSSTMPKRQHRPRLQRHYERQHMRLNKLSVARYNTAGVHVLPPHLKTGIACSAGVVLRTSAAGQEVYSTVARAEAIAAHAGSIAMATAAGSKAHATIKGSKSFALADKAMAYAMVKGSTAYATFEGARASSPNQTGTIVIDPIQSVFPRHTRVLDIRPS